MLQERRDLPGRLHPTDPTAGTFQDKENPLLESASSWPPTLQRGHTSTFSGSGEPKGGVLEFHWGRLGEIQSGILALKQPGCVSGDWILPQAYDLNSRTLG